MAKDEEVDVEAVPEVEEELDKSINIIKLIDAS